jgi:hypothetical protein
MSVGLLAIPRGKFGVADDRKTSWAKIEVVRFGRAQIRYSRK